jgi:hypothetical protein
MDKSSRNIVVFIATITVAALLIMAARNYADSQKTERPADAAEKIAKPKAPVIDVSAEEPNDQATDPLNQEEAPVEEDAEIIMGEPSINLEQGGTPDYAPPPAQSDVPDGQ